LPADDNHPDQVNADENRVLEKHIQRTHYRCFYLIYISGYTRQDIPFAFFREEPERKLGDFPVDLIAYVAHYACPDGNHHKKRQIHGRHFEEGHYHEEDSQNDKGERTSLGLNQIADKPEEIVLQKLRDFFQGFPIAEVPHNRCVGIDILVYFE